MTERLTTHQLAKLLLETEDVPVFTYSEDASALAPVVKLDTTTKEEQSWEWRTKSILNEGKVPTDREAYRHERVKVRCRPLDALQEELPEKLVVIEFER